MGGACCRGKQHNSINSAFHSRVRNWFEIKGAYLRSPVNGLVKRFQLLPHRTHLILRLRDSNHGNTSVNIVIELV